MFKVKKLLIIILYIFYIHLLFKIILLSTKHFCLKEEKKHFKLLLLFKYEKKIQFY